MQVYTEMQLCFAVHLMSHFINLCKFNDNELGKDKTLKKLMFINYLKVIYSVDYTFSAKLK